jgi:hypothetical protein
MFRSYAAMPYKFLPRQKRACLEPCSDVLLFYSLQTQKTPNMTKKKPGKTEKMDGEKGAKGIRKLSVQFKF